MPVTEIDFDAPAFLFANTAVPLTVSVSPPTLSSRYVTAAVVLPSYVFPPPDTVTVRALAVMLAVVVAVELGV